MMCDIPEKGRAIQSLILIGLLIFIFYIIGIVLPSIKKIIKNVNSKQLETYTNSLML